MFDVKTRKVAILLAGFIAALPAWGYESSYNMTRGVTPVSHAVYELHMTIFWVCVAIAVVVWTAVPVLILVAMAVPAAKTLIMMEDTRGSELSVKITGYQWQWQYEYLGEGVSFYSKLSQDSNEARQRGSGIDPATVKDYLLSVDNPMVVPVDTKVRVLLTGSDVIHAWWVPDFAIKKDAIPGFVNESWFKAEKIGHYVGQCAELCGRDHGFMPIAVDVVSKEDYAKWLAAKKEAAKEAAAAPAPAATTAANVAEDASRVAQ
jgi:cytochrome c oxidase subunit 2